MVGESLGFFRRTPGLSNQAIDVGPKHREGVVEAEEGIPATPFEFPLARHTTPSALEGQMSRSREVPSEVNGIPGILVGSNEGSRGYKRLNSSEERL